MKMSLIRKTTKDKKETISLKQEELNLASDEVELKEIEHSLFLLQREEQSFHVMIGQVQNIKSTIEKYGLSKALVSVIYDEDGFLAKNKIIPSIEMLNDDSKLNDELAKASIEGIISFGMSIIQAIINFIKAIITNLIALIKKIFNIGDAKRKRLDTIKTELKEIKKKNSKLNIDDISVENILHFSDLTEMSDSLYRCTLSELNVGAPAHFKRSAFYKKFMDFLKEIEVQTEKISNFAMRNQPYNQLDIDNAMAQGIYRIKIAYFLQLEKFTQNDLSHLRLKVEKTTLGTQEIQRVTNGGIYKKSETRRMTLKEAKISDYNLAMIETGANDINKYLESTIALDSAKLLAHLKTEAVRVLELYVKYTKSKNAIPNQTIGEACHIVQTILNALTTIHGNFVIVSSNFSSICIRILDAVIAADKKKEK